jgi:hypothetical protein
LAQIGDSRIEIPQKSKQDDFVPTCFVMLSFAQLRTAGAQSSICIGATDTAQHVDLALTTVTWRVDGWINVRLDAWLIVGCVIIAMQRALWSFRDL